MPDSVMVFDLMTCSGRRKILDTTLFVKDPEKDIPKWDEKKAGVKSVLGIKNPDDCTTEELERLLTLARFITALHDQHFDSKLRVKRLIVVTKVSEGDWVFTQANRLTTIQHFQNLDQLEEMLKTILNAPVPCEGAEAASL